MSDHDLDPDAPLSPEERALHAAWPTLTPPPGFAEQVLARAERPPGQLRRRSIAPWLLAAAALLALISRFVSLPTSGHHLASMRQTLELGARAVAVVEPDSEISWAISAAGRTVVEQKSGAAFYRVEPGGDFVVHTSEGDLRVVGTCFRVEVTQVKAMSAGAAGAAVGAAVAALLTVTVYEGRVVVDASGGASTAIAPGETARIQRGKAPELSGAALALSTPRAPAAAASAPASAGSIAKTAQLPAGLTPEQLYQAHGKLAEEADGLRQKVAALEQKLGQTTQKSREHKTYDLTPEELKEMADRCELRWDVPGLGPEPQQLGPKDAESLHVAEEERATINRIMKDNHERLTKQIAAIYVEATGDTSTGSLATQAMMQEIFDKAPKGEESQLHQRLAQERAGLIPPKADGAMSPQEKLLRLLSTAGDGLQSELAKELGPATAQSLRDQHEGWGSRSRSRTNCPGKPGEE